RNYHVSITSGPFPQTLLTLRHKPKTPHPFENKLAEACASRTHRRHQRCRPPVWKPARITGPHSLPFELGQKSSLDRDLIVVALSSADRASRSSSRLGISVL